MDYTQANTKKKEIASKMKVTMNGKNSGKGGSMSYPQSSTGGKGNLNMKFDMNGKSQKSGGEKFPMSNGKSSFNAPKFYSQTGKK